MAKRNEIPVQPKKRGRPATGRDPLFGVRLPEGLAAQVDAAAKADGTSRSEVIRDAVERDMKRRARTPKHPARQAKPD